MSAPSSEGCREPDWEQQELEEERKHMLLAALDNVRWAGLVKTADILASELGLSTEWKKEIENGQSR